MNQKKYLHVFDVLTGIINKLRKEWFLLAMFLAIFLASIAPHLGKTGGVLHANILADCGIALVFFLHGLGLSFEKMKQGLMSWRVHITVQILTFVLFPVIWYLSDRVLGNYIPRDLALGFCYLCALPSTVSSSVAMTGIARGNVPAAIFNATISGLIGIVLTPLIITVFSGLGGAGLSFTDAVAGIAKLLLIPLVLGQFSRPLLHRLHQKYKAITGSVDRFAILLMIYTAFCDSVSSGLWRNNGIGLIVSAMLGAATILCVVLIFSTWLAKYLRFNTEDEITTVFCGSKKTLASGVPMAKLIFGSHPALGLIMLPIIFYHQIQLIVCSVLANRYARRFES